jgi:prolyl 4-hydroxylase
MSILDDANRLAAAGQGQAAVELVRNAAKSGDPEALFAVANWRLFGLHGPRDLQEAHRLLDQARAAGHIEATRLKATLVGNGTGCPSNLGKAAKILRDIQTRDPFANIQLVFSQKMRSESEAARLRSEQLCESPHIRVVRGLLSKEECGYLIALAGPELQPSFVIDPRTGGRMPHPVRTSSGMSFGPTMEDRVIHLINRRLAKVTRTRVECGEPLHMLKYLPGEEYKVHLDALPGATNQREWTVLLYLNDEYTGGATRVEARDIEFRGGVGDALIFRNVLDSGLGDPDARHAGLPVETGTKWLATRWIRKSTYHPWDAA